MVKLYGNAKEITLWFWHNSFFVNFFFFEWNIDMYFIKKNIRFIDKILDIKRNL